MKKKQSHNTAFFKPKTSNKKALISKKLEEQGLTIFQAPSPFFTNKTITPDSVALHTSGYPKPLDVFKRNNVSCHYFIPLQEIADKLIVYEVVKPPLRAWHAGKSSWKDKKNLNDYAIGIEIHMPNYAHALENKTLDFLYFESFQPRQIEALKILIKQLQAEYNIPTENIIGHSDIAPWRNISGSIELGKTDPGPTLPWKKLAEEGFGIWPRDNCLDEIAEDLSAKAAQRLLKQVGYNVPQTGVFDKETNLTIGAARLHWTPTCFNSTSGLAHTCYEKPFDKELACSLYNLSNQKYDPPSNPPILLMVLATTTPILLLVIVCLIYKYCKSNHSPRNDYEEINDGDNEETFRRRYI